jgi:siroheme synthase-like protein
MLIPLNIDLNKKRCLVIGAGHVAYRKIKKLLEYKADIKVISRELKNDEIKKLVNKKKIKYENKEFENNVEENYFLVITATNDKEVNNRIAKYLDKKNILVNNSSGFCNCIFPAVLNRKNLQVAVSTEGVSPLFSAKLRDKIVKIIPTKYNEIIKLLKIYRTKAKKNINDQHKRNIFLNEITDYIIDLDAFDIKKIKNDLVKIFKYHKKKDNK